MVEYHPLVSQIIKLLEDNDVWFETFEHNEVQTSEEAAQIRDGYTLSQGAKALIIKITHSTIDNEYVMLLVPGDCRFNSKKVRNLLGVKQLRFATPEEVAEVTGGVQVGGVPPFGNLFGLRVLADPRLFENEKIVFNAGDRCFSIGMFSADYQRIVQPHIVSIV